MARVELEGVNKVYSSGHGAVHAVRDLSLTVADGDFVALLGPSGCGKTSTLRMIVGLEEITSGLIRFDGQEVNALSPEQRNVAMAFETYALYPNFTVAENLGFPLEVRGVTRTARNDRVRHIAKLLRIQDILEHKPGQLSGGQQQRVSLGRALIRDPAVFILDEVMSHLDAHLKFQMLFELKRLHQSIGKTMVYVTHDQMEALALADRVAVMNNGLLQQFGTRDELYHHPVNRFVADFIGEPPTNFFEAVPSEDADGFWLRVSGARSLRLRPSAKRTTTLRRSRRDGVIVGLRPQSLLIEPRPGSASLDAVVDLNEYLGEHAILTLSDGPVRFRALTGPDVAVAEGEPVRLHYRPDDVLIFDKETEALID
jgi:multiple sugar transport system ATP-binding protein